MSRHVTYMNIDYQHSHWRNKWWMNILCCFKITHPVNYYCTKFKFVQSTNLISQKLSDSVVELATTVSKRCSRCTQDLLVVKTQVLDFCFPTIQSFQKLFLKTTFHFIPSSAFLGFWKALEQDAMSSSISIVRRRKVLNTCKVWFSCIIISYVMFFSYANFQHSQKASLLSTPLRHAFPGMFLKSFKTLAAGVLSGLKLLAFGSWFYTR